MQPIDTDRSRRPRVAFILEHTLGHITHGANLQRLVGADPTIEPVFASIPFDATGWVGRLPGYRNWTVRAGLRARRALRAIRHGGPVDALFVHTQVPAILLQDRFRQQPTVVSLDATPRQYDELGEHYGHEVGASAAERLKWRANVRCFRRASAIVTWAHWTKAGLVRDYEVPADKVVVIPPGVDLELWTAPERAPRAPSEPLRVLFVGGDLERKGGLHLIDAVSRLRADGADVELDLVTRDDPPRADGVRVHHGLTPNSPELIELYRRAHVFCLPTLGDCLPMVLSEAGATGLPLVSTDVGAISEIVQEGDSGLLVPPSDPAALAAALRRLHDDETLRQRLGEGASRIVARDFDAAANARRLVELLGEVAGTRRATG